MTTVHNKTVINIETGAVVFDDAFQWSGPVVHTGGGKAPKTQVVQPPPPTQEEIEARQMSNFMAKMQMNEMGYEANPSNRTQAQIDSDIAYRQNILDTGLNQGNKIDEAERTGTQAAIDAFRNEKPGAGGFRKRALTQEEIDQADLEKKIMARFREDLDKRPGQVSPEEEAALNELYVSEQSKMDEELQRFAIESSGSRGLSMGDTPLAREVLRAKSRGQTELGVARAGSKLQFAEKERLFNQGLASWRSDLQQQRMSNLMAAQGQAGNTAIGFMNARGNLKPGMFQGAGGGGSNVGGIVSGVGAAVGGIAAAF